MRGITRRRIYFVFSLAILISILVWLIWNLFLPKLEDTTISHVSEPVKNELVKQATFWVLVGLGVLLIVVYFIDKTISRD